uniref:Uncharacterized protein n=1 Tax=Arundo donax TaxID=35708 RepID=A0A0A9AIW6_ARUDO
MVKSQTKVTSGVLTRPNSNKQGRRFLKWARSPLFSWASARRSRPSPARGYYWGSVSEHHPRL